VFTPVDIRRKFRELELYERERLHESLHPSEDTQWKIDSSDEVTTRNRYSNIAAWDSNRIRLRVPAKYCDYINASPIVLKGRNGSVKRYIATQVRDRDTGGAILVFIPRDGSLSRNVCGEQS